MDYVKVLYNKLISSGSPRALKRFNHSLGVAFKALEIIEDNHLNVDKDKAYVAGLLHDYSKFSNIERYYEVVEKYDISKEILEENEKVFHGILGYLIVKEELGIEDEEILNAIKYHVFGSDNMTELEEVIYLADYIENNRVGEEYELAREVAKTDYKKAIALESAATMQHLLNKGENIHPNAYSTYNKYKKYN